jgi:hypothetical protein
MLPPNMLVAFPTGTVRHRMDTDGYVRCYPKNWRKRQPAKQTGLREATKETHLPTCRMCFGGLAGLNEE